MSGDGIFFRVGDDLVLLEEQQYDSESLLQEALARYPEVLAGPTTEGDGEGRLLLLGREAGVPSAEGGVRTFSLDHLFIDQQGVPVLVEVKRSSDTRIRREVIGQMLDYAANGVKYWPLSLLRQSLEARAAGEEKSVEDLLAELQSDLDPDDFWKAVEANLIAGRIRMIIVADKLPAELVRVIEFLNEQMNPAEVLGVELRQFVAGSHVAYVPRVVGRTVVAVDKKSIGRRWTRDSFLEIANERCSDVEVQLIEQLFAHVDTRGTKLAWGSGANPGVGGWYNIDGRSTVVWVLNTSSDSPTTRAHIVFYFADLVGRAGLERMEEAASMLEQIPVLRQKIVDSRASGWKKYPSLYLSDVASNPAAIKTIFDAILKLVD
ncbi:hypothetical protein [Kribbella sp. NPDC051620]|uniref:hypothetical protein n=1 Tax=Kribbella sp. NPDC051620 TaxID=3364120 RepID=UPI0037AD8D84